MLRVPTPFPEQGSFALLDHDGRTHAVRILQRDQEGFVRISLPARLGAASGNLRVPFDQLIDPTPLTEEERAELKRLEGFVLTEGPRPSQARAAKISRKRYHALRLRDIHAATLQTLLAALPKVAA